MKNELIKVNYDYENDRITTSARTLWDRLNRPYDKFTKWFNKYKEYGFLENEDYREVCTKIHTSCGAAHEAVDYEITLDMAKQLCMLQRTPEGMAYRKYFLELEKKWNSPEYVMKRALELANQKIKALELKVEEQKPLVAFAETALKSKDNILVRQLAKIAKDEGIEIGEKRLYNKLRSWKIIMPNSTEPYQQYVDKGYFVVEEKPIDTPYGVKLVRTTKVTPKGQVYIIERLKKEF